MPTTRRLSALANSGPAGHQQLLDTLDAFKKRHVAQNKVIVARNSELLKENTQLGVEKGDLIKEIQSLWDANGALKRENFRLEVKVTALTEALKKERGRRDVEGEKRLEKTVQSSLTSIISQLTSLANAVSPPAVTDRYTQRTVRPRASTISSPSDARHEVDILEQSFSTVPMPLAPTQQAKLRSIRQSLGPNTRRASQLPGLNSITEKSFSLEMEERDIAAKPVSLPSSASSLRSLSLSPSPPPRVKPPLCGNSLNERPNGSNTGTQDALLRRTSTRRQSSLFTIPPPQNADLSPVNNLPENQTADTKETREKLTIGPKGVRSRRSSTSDASTTVANSNSISSKTNVTSRDSRIVSAPASIKQHVKIDPKEVKLPDSDEDSSDLSEVESEDDQDKSQVTSDEEDESDNDDIVRKSLVRSARKVKRSTGKITKDESDDELPSQDVRAEDILSDRSNIDEGIVRASPLRNRKRMVEMEVLNEEGQSQSTPQIFSPPIREPRRSRSNVNYALPKLNSKMRQAEGFVSSIKSTTKARKSTRSITTLDSKGRPLSPTSSTSSTVTRKSATTTASKDENSPPSTVRSRATSPALEPSGANIVRMESLSASQRSSISLSKPMTKVSGEGDLTLAGKRKSVMMSIETLERRKKGMEWVKELVGGVTLDDFETDDENKMPMEWLNARERGRSRSYSMGS